jgi:pimeloyl-ACP methyl ester carboxylesterase
MKTASKDGTQIAYDKTGKGPALIIINGALSYRQNGSTKALVKLLAEHFTVYDYDRRGRGESTDTAPYAVRRETEDLAAVAAVTGEEPFVCAFSSGCAVVLHAIDHGQKFRKIVLYEPPFVALQPQEELPVAEVKKKLGDLLAAGKRSKAVSYFLRKVVGMPALIVFLFRWLNRSAWKKNESIAHTLMYDLDVMGNLAFPAGLAADNVAPVLVVGGEKSPVQLANAVRNVAKQVPHAQTLFLKDQKHNVSVEVLTPELLRFYIGK